MTSEPVRRTRHATQTVGPGVAAECRLCIPTRKPEYSLGTRSPNPDPTSEPAFRIRLCDTNSGPDFRTGIRNPHLARDTAAKFTTHIHIRVPHPNSIPAFGEAREPVAATRVPHVCARARCGFVVCPEFQMWAKSSPTQNPGTAVRLPHTGSDFARRVFVFGVVIPRFGSRQPERASNPNAGPEFEHEVGTQIRYPNWEPGFGIRIRNPT